MVSKWDEFEEVKPQNKDVWSQFEEVKPTQPNAWAQFEEVKPAKTTSKTKPIAQPNSIQASKQAEIERIKKNYEEEIKQIDKEYNQDKKRLALGATVQGLSALPINKVPFVGSALGGALFDAGGAIMEGASGADIAKRAGRGALAGVTVEGTIRSVPFVGNHLANTQLGQNAIKGVNQATQKLLATPVAQKISKATAPVVEKIGEELTKTRTLGKPRVETSVKAEIVQPKVVNTVESQTALQPQTEIKKRSGIDTVTKHYGEDLSNQITDSTYQVRGAEVAKAEFDALSPEKQIQLINSADDTSDVATYAKAQYLKQEINNGNVPISTLNKWVSLGTKKGQELQAQQFLAPDTLEGAVVQMQNAIYKAQPKQTQKILDSVDEIVNKVKGLTPAQKAAQIDKMLAEKAIKPKERKTFIDKMLKLDELGSLNSENITRLINKEFNIPEIDATDIERLNTLVGQINKAQTQREKDIATQLMAKTINKKLPVNLADIDQTYRTINMLLSPKSRTKDALGTALYQGERFLDEAFAKIPALVSRAKGFKTRDLGFENKEWRKGFKRGLKEVHEDVQMGINTGRSGEGARFDLTKVPQFEGVPILEQAEKLLNYSIKGVDRPFYEAAYNASIANQLKAQGLKEPTEEIVEQAVKEAQQAVFQRNGILTDIGLKGREFLNFKGTPLEKLRLGQRNIPFLQTASNLTQEGLNASPLTIPFNLAKYAKAQTLGELRDAELALGKNIKGALLYGPAGYALSQNPDKTNIGTLNSLDASGNDITGLPAQGVAIGNKAFSLANMPQSVIPLAIYKNMFEADTLGQGLARGGLQAITSLADLPALKGVGDIAKGTGDVVRAISAEAQGQKDAINNASSRFLKQYLSNQLGQYVPVGGFLGNIRNVVDPAKRELTTDNTNAGIVQYIGNRIKNRLPIASETLPIKYNVLGEPMLNTNIKNPIARAAGELIDPFSIRNYAPQPYVMQELEDLKAYAKANDIQGANTLNLRKAEKKINGQPLTAQQISDYQRTLGQLNYNSLNNLMTSPQYQMLPEEEKVKEINMRLKYNNQLVKNKLFGVPLENQSSQSKAKQRLQKVLGKQRTARKNRYKQEVSKLFNMIMNQEK